jgi:hypothetical protein
MAGRQKLDAARRAGGCQLISLLLALVIASSAVGQEALSDGARLSAAQKSFDAGKWEDAARLAAGTPEQSAELDFLAGLALAKLQRWDDARRAFETGHGKAPNDPRFLVELAGVSYKQNDLGSAKRNLSAALRLDSRDSYTRDFLGTIYFLEGNLEAALKYWNPIDKPRLRNVPVQLTPRLRETLLKRAITFNAPQVLTRESLLNTQARLDNLGVFPQRRFALAPAGGGNYDATLHLGERNGWGDSKLEGAFSLLSGLPYATVYPQFYNLGHRAVNFTSLLRWDSEKRRAYANLSTPLANDPALRFQAYVDVRNENWNLTNTFFGGGAPLSDLNTRRIVGGAELKSVVNGTWSWRTGIEVANRSFRNLAGHTSSTEKPFFTEATSFVSRLEADRWLVRLPERRFTVASSAEARLGRQFADGLGTFGTLRGSLDAHWFPRSKDDDYEMHAVLRAGDTAGKMTFDELFQLGVERDNDLWLRGHPGTSGGRKGAAPLGRRYFLANWEVDKNVYANGFVSVKLGPFVDNGTIADSSGLFGSQRWLWDTGAQCKVRILGGITVVLIYGKELRSGRNTFYGTVLRYDTLLR